MSELLRQQTTLSARGSIDTAIDIARFESGRLKSEFFAMTLLSAFSQFEEIGDAGRKRLNEARCAIESALASVTK